MYGFVAGPTLEPVRSTKSRILLKRVTMGRNNQKNDNYVVFDKVYEIVEESDEFLDARSLAESTAVSQEKPNKDAGVLWG